MRTIISVICSLVALMAVYGLYGLDTSYRHSARQEVPANFEIQPGLVDDDHTGMEPPRYAE